MQTPIASTAALLLFVALGPALAQEGRVAAPEALASATAAPDRPLSAMPSYRLPALRWKSHEDARPDETICNDRIFSAREQAGQPPLEREPATGDEPLLIWAVDRREDGCAVLVAKGNPEDIRPIPKIEEQYTLRPAVQ